MPRARAASFTAASSFRSASARSRSTRGPPTRSPLRSGAMPGSSWPTASSTVRRSRPPAKSKRPASSASSGSSSRAFPTSPRRVAADRTARPGISTVIDPAIWPLATTVDRRGRLRVGVTDLSALSERLGTPLYVYDAATIRDAHRRYVGAFKALRPVRLSYAIKACALRGVARIIAEAGADASVASLGELLAAKRAGFPVARTQMHGNAKTDDELRAALRLGVGRIVIDGADEIDRLRAFVARRSRPQPVWLRVSPGIGADTHPHLRTGLIDSKFGAPIAGGDALAQCRAIVATKNLRLIGIHAHLGTQLHEAERYRELGDALAGLARDIRRTTGAAYTALLADRASAPPIEHVAIAGKYCESGDLLIGDVALATPVRGEVLAIPAAGAYSVAMASNYNHHPRPAVAIIEGGRAAVIRRRESHADIWRLER